MPLKSDQMVFQMVTLNTLISTMLFKGLIAFDSLALLLRAIAIELAKVVDVATSDFSECGIGVSPQINNRITTGLHPEISLLQQTLQQQPYCEFCSKADRAIRCIGTKPIIAIAEIAANFAN